MCDSEWQGQSFSAHILNHAWVSGSYFTPKSKPKNKNSVLCHQNKAYNNVNGSKIDLIFFMRLNIGV